MIRQYALKDGEDVMTHDKAVLRQAFDVVGAYAYRRRKRTWPVDTRNARNDRTDPDVHHAPGNDHHVLRTEVVEVRDPDRAPPEHA